MKNLRLGMTLVLFAFLALATSGSAWAQATGSVVGTVADTSGAVVPSADVTLTNLGTNVTQKAQSNANGNFQFLQLIPGNYQLTVEKTGFQKYVVNPVQVAVGVATRADASLQVGATTQTVEVTTEAPLLSTQSSSLDYGVESKEVQQLPLNGRDPMNLAELVPGVVPQGGTSGAPTGNVNGWGNYQIGGGTSNQSAEYIDGAPINVSYDNSAILVPNQDAIQEFQVATNNVSPEYGRFAGGVINMATKSGTNDFHGSLYEYVRNGALNANTWFNNNTGVARPVLNQNQYGANIGGPALKDKAFFFLSWEQLDVHTQTTTQTYVPTLQMLAGDFSQVPVQLYDPNNATCGANGLGLNSGTNRCAFVPANGYNGTGQGQTPGANNQIPQNEINQAALNLTKQLFPAPTNNNNPYAATPSVANFVATNPSTTDENQWTARGDENVGSKNKLFERFTDWHKNNFGISATHTLVGNKSYFGADQAVLGDTVTINPTLVADFRLSFLRFVDRSIPLSCCNFNYGTEIGPGWANMQTGVTFPQLPEPNITGLNNFSGAAIILDTDNAYVGSAAFTKMLGRHSITFGGELRKIEWDYAQSNSAGSTFNFPSGQGYSSSSMSDSKTGWGLAGMLLGYPTYAQTAEPALSKGVMWYSGLYVADSFRMTPKLTINAGLRWEQPGSFTETHGRLTTLLTNLPQPAVSAALGRTVTGGLGLINSSVYPHKDWQQLDWHVFSPRVGLAYSPTDRWVFRGGFGIAFLPPTVSFSYGPYNSPLNLATTTETSTNPNPSISMTNPFPNGVATPPSGAGALQAIIDSLLGSGIQSPVPVQTPAYNMQWNMGFQKQLGNSAMVNVGYVGSRGDHLPLYSVNLDQLPDSYLPDAGTGDANDPFVSVPNPLSAAHGGPIATNVPTLGAANVLRGYLEKPAPQYLYMTADSPNIGFTFYEALQVMAQKRFGQGGIASVAWTFSNMVGTADDLNAWLEGSRYDVGGGEGVQDNDNIRGNATNPGEFSKSSFTVPHRVVVNYVYPLPIGKGKRFLGNASGLVNGVVGDWTVNGLTTFQNGFPLGFQDSSTNALETDFAAGYAGPGLLAGVTRPNYVAGCDPKIYVKPSQKLNDWFNKSCYSVPGPYQFGNEPRVDYSLRSQGIDSTDFSVAKDIPFSDRYRLDFRAEFFNLFNWTQFSVPNDQVDNPNQEGKVTAQYNSPRAIQFSGRFSF